jgi:hypothetical protein
MSNPNLWSLIIAALALLVSGTTLGWNILSYLLQGQRAKLNIGPIRVLDTEGTSEKERAIQITVISTGRVPVEVTGWSVRFPNDVHLHSELISLQYRQFESIHLGDEIPKLIQPGGRGTFLLPRVAVEAAAKHYDLDLDGGRIHVYFAARKPLRDKRRISFHLSSKHKQRQRGFWASVLYLYQHGRG